MNKQEALVKLATVRMAINHVLRTRALKKQAGWWEDLNRAAEDTLTDLDMNPDRVNSIGNVGTANYVRDLGGTRDAAGTMARYEHPENFPAMLVWPFDGPLRESQERVKRIQKQDPLKIKAEMDAAQAPIPRKKTRMIPPPIRPKSGQPAPSVAQPPLPAGTLQPGGLFPFR